MLARCPSQDLKIVPEVMRTFLDALKAPQFLFYNRKIIPRDVSKTDVTIANSNKQIVV